MRSWPIAAMLIRRSIGSRRGLLVNLLVPAAVLGLVVGLFGASENNPAVIAVHNADQGLLGSYIADSLSRDGKYDLRAAEADSDADAAESLRQAVRNGEADAAVYVPADFTERLLAGERPQALVYRQSEQLWNAALLAALQSEAARLDSVVNLVRERHGAPKAEDLAPLLAQMSVERVSAREADLKLGLVVSNPTVIGVMLMFVMLLANQTIVYVLEDRIHRTMARMYAAPVRSADIAAGNFVGSMLVGAMQLVIGLIVMRYVFGYTVGGVPFVSLLLVAACFLFGAVGLASALAGLVRNTNQLGQLNTLAVTLTCMLGGCFWPLSITPEFMQKLANLTPQKWALDAIDRLSSGAGLPDIALHLAILLLFGAVSLAFGAASLQPGRSAA
ncbi:ABC transporter permease [Paenibacillus thermoaerophilus]|uniref:ABC transporter permease n=1 Tax=Paenibacillus thermoaerophilus TaxID=1215385 RepID=A0ABW2UZI8_9BACL|nr:ABC transporter permease [Paenibacillus thermoaerophilus]TMV17361.1 ABC transporter permease [Paenibacillus thermoaerophilus]